MTFPDLSVGFQNPGPITATRLTIIGSAGQKIVGVVSGGIASFQFFSGASEEQTPGTIEELITNPGVSEIMRLFINGPQGQAPNNDYVALYLSSRAKDGSIPPGLSLVYVDTSNTVHLYGNVTPNGFRMAGGNPGDSNTYQGERLSVPLNGSILVNTSAFSQVGATVVCGVGQYLLDGQVMISPTGAGGTAGIEFAGGGAFVASSSGLTWTDDIMGNPYTPGSMSFTDPAIGSLFTTGTLTAGRRLIKFRGIVNVSTAGTLALFMNAPGGVGSFNINSRTTSYDLFPIGP